MYEKSANGQTDFAAAFTGQSVRLLAMFAMVLVEKCVLESMYVCYGMLLVLFRVDDAGGSVHTPSALGVSRNHPQSESMSWT